MAKKNPKREFLEMTKKAKAKRRTLSLDGKKGESIDSVAAQAAINPSIAAAKTIMQFSTQGFDEVDITTLVEKLTEQTNATNRNDLDSLEAMLTAQAHALDAIFNKMALSAAANMGEYLAATDTFLKLGLRAQSQCRSTIEAISAIKNPPMMGYVKQANIAQGHQQVNNAPHAREKQNPQNKLLEKQNGKRLDTSTASKAIEEDSAMETVGAINRAKDTRR
jgi:hypothetical protein